MNILAYDFWWMCVFISLEKLLDHKVDIYLVATARQFSKMDSHQQQSRVPGTPCPGHHLVLSISLIFAILVDGETQG